MGLVSKYGLSPLYQLPDWPSNNEVVSLGSEYVIEAGSDPLDYLAFPDLAIGSTGTLYIAYREGSDHNISLNANIVFRKSTDNGVTWTSPVIVQEPDPTDRLVGAGCGVTSTNRIIVSYLYKTVSGLRSMYIKYSDDDGDTWSSEIKVTTDFEPDGQLAGPQGFFEQDGILYKPVYARYLNSGTRGCFIYKSSDFGLTWTYYAEQYPISAFDFEEPYLGGLPNDILISTLRSDPEGETYITYSFDGLNWSDPYQIQVGGGKSPIASNPNGTVVIIDRNLGVDNRATYSYSNNYGRTWNGPFNLDDRQDPYMYAGIVWSQQINKFIVVWASETGNIETDFVSPTTLYCKYLNVSSNDIGEITIKLRSEGLSINTLI